MYIFIFTFRKDFLFVPLRYKINHSAGDFIRVRKAQKMLAPMDRL